MIRLLLLVFVTISALTSAFTQPLWNPEGKPDRSFGEGGFAYTHPDLRVWSWPSGVQPDGKVVWAFDGLLVARQLENGSPDTTFGQDGVKQFTLPGFGAARSVAIQPDGKIVIAGYVDRSSGGRWDFFILRLLPNGDPDSAFGKAGFQYFDFAPQGSGLISIEMASSVLTMPDGKIVASGISEQFMTGAARSSTYVILISLNPDGSLDSTFGAGGVSRQLVGSNTANTYSGYILINRQQDGKIIAGTTVQRENPNSPGQYSERGIVLRYLPNGSLDKTFSDDGEFDINATSPPGCCVLREIEGGKILLLTWEGLIRLNSNGTFDSLFGNGGRAPLGPGSFPIDFDVYQDGKIIVSRIGYRNVQGGQPIETGMLQRFWPDGSPDVRFGNAGTTILDLGRNLRLGYVKIVQDKYLVFRGAAESPFPGGPGPPRYSPFIAKFHAKRKL